MEAQGASASSRRQSRSGVMLRPGTSAPQIEQMCYMNKKGCNLAGHPHGGVPFLELTANEKDLELVLGASNGAAKYVEPDSEVYMIPEIEADVQAATWGLNRVGADQRGRSGSGATVFAGHRCACDPQRV